MPGGSYHKAIVARIVKKIIRFMLLVPLYTMRPVVVSALWIAAFNWLDNAKASNSSGVSNFFSLDNCFMNCKDALHAASRSGFDSQPLALGGVRCGLDMIYLSS